MPSQDELNKMIADAKSHGVDMSWLQTPSVSATGGAERISPGASQLMDAVRQAQQSPVYMPFPGGTPTQARRQADEATRQFETGHDFSREQFDWQRDIDARDFEADQSYRNQQLALSRAGSAGGGVGTAGGYADRTGTLTERDRIPFSDAGRAMITNIRDNPHLTLGELKANASTYEADLSREGISLSDFLEFIERQYTMYHLLEAQSRVGQNVQSWDYGQDLQQRQDLIQKHNPWAQPAQPAQELTDTQMNQQWWDGLGPQQQAEIKSQLVKAYGEITTDNIEMLSPEQLWSLWNGMLKRD